MPTLAKRVENEKKRIAAKGGVSRSGKTLSEAEVARRATARAERKRYKYQSRANKTSSNASVRAYGTASPTLSAVAPRSEKKAVGRAIRRERTRTNKDIGTGEQLSALKAGRKAVKRSVKRGSITRRQGNMTLKQLASLDPSTRRAIVNSSGQAAAEGRTGHEGGFMNAKGQAIARKAKSLRKIVRKASKKTE